MPEQQTLIRGVRIADSTASKDGELLDILIADGRIEKISSSIKPSGNFKEIDGKGGWLVPGLFDLRVRSGDPGNEHKEDLGTLCAAAAAGGVTGLAVLPDTLPVIQSKATVDYIANRTKDYLTSVYSLGAATENLEGTELSELHDLRLAGVVGYSNADVPYHDAATLTKLLQYTGTFGLPVHTHAEDLSIAGKGSVNESESTIHTGLKVRPGMAEYIQVRSQLEVLRYAGGKLHISHISCRESVDAIREAKSEGLDVTCDVNVYHLAFNDEVLIQFDSNFKLLPPLRTETDRVALVEGVNDGTIDVITSDHQPQNVEEKKKEFDFAGFGATGVQTLWQVYFGILSKEIEMSQWIKATAQNPRNICGLEFTEIEEGNVADLAIIAPEEKWFLDRTTNRSKAENHPLWHGEMTGKVIYTCNGVKEYSI